MCIKSVAPAVSGPPSTQLRSSSSVFTSHLDAGPYSAYDTLQNSSCSSCEIQADRSMYWTPQLYYHHGNGTVEEVRNEGMTVYYVGELRPRSDLRSITARVGRGANSSWTTAFPPGFRMIAGDSTARSYDDQSWTYLQVRPVADRVSFRCINDANDLPEKPYMWRTDCSNGMRAQINFPSCWDGVNLFLERSQHVAYLSNIESGVCPPEFPKFIPGLFFEGEYAPLCSDL